jgi:hypothetical protein
MKKMMFKKAWLVLNNGKATDILSSRNDFDAAYEYAKNLYCHLHLPLSEKVLLAHYSWGNKRKTELFNKSIHVATSYQTDLYRDLMRSTAEDINSFRTKELLKKWQKAPEFIRVGLNPFVEVKKIFNIERVEHSGKVILSYEELRIDGKREISRLAIN